MNTPILWRDACAMSKALRRSLADKPTGPLTPEDSQNIIGSLLLIPANHPTALPPTPPITKVAFHQQPTKAAPLDGGLLLGESKKRGWFKKRSSVWMTDQGLLAQTVLFGCTGAGRTETLLTMALNAVRAPKRLQNHYPKPSAKSVFYMDGKGDNSLYTKVVSGLSECQSIGELRVINMMVGGKTKDDIIKKGDKLSHSLDLFAGFTERMLHQWLLDMVSLDLQETEDWRSAAQAHLGMVAFLAMAWSRQTHKRITPCALGYLMTSVGTEDYAQHLEGSSKHAARQWRDLVWGKGGQTEAAAFLEAYGQQIQRSFEPLGHVFESQTPEVGLCHLQDREHTQRFVLVLAPAMERATDDMRMVTRAIATSLRLSLESRPVMKTCDTLVVMDEFGFCLEPQDVSKLCQTRNRGAGLVWGSGGPKEGFARDAALFSEGWEPATHIMMKQCHHDTHGGHYSHDYMHQQRNKNPGLGLPGPDFFGDIYAGQSMAWNSHQKIELSMDYFNAPSISALFIAHARPLPFSVPQTTNVQQLFLDKTRMAKALKLRVGEWTNDKPPALSWCQETTARLLGFSNWHEAHEVLKKSE